MKTGSRRRLLASAATISLAATMIVCVAAATQDQAPAAKPLKGIAVRGCLTGSRLTHVEAADPGTTFPASLGINAIRAIRTQLKTLNGHQVELIGSVEGVGPQTGGILVSESDKAKVYLGGGDPSLGDDFRRIVPPTFYANTIRDLAPACTAQSHK